MKSELEILRADKLNTVLLKYQYLNKICLAQIFLFKKNNFIINFYKEKYKIISSENYYAIFFRI